MVSNCLLLSTLAAAAATAISAETQNDCTSLSYWLSGDITAPIEGHPDLKVRYIKKGTGKTYPKVDTTCQVKYAGFFPETKKEFDSGTLDFAPKQVISCWKLMMQQMVQGDEICVYCPSDLAYGSRGAHGTIPKDADLVFSMNMLSVPVQAARQGL